MIERQIGGARACFTDRHGGVSQAPFDSLNLAHHVGDDPRAVTENQARAARRADAPHAAWMLPRHVHGSTVRTWIPGDTETSTTTRPGETGDGAATNRAGVLLVALGADCAPVAIANDTACCAIHAGWRGAVGGVVEAGVAAVRALGTGRVRAVVGPCICPAHYEFGATALDELAARHGEEVRGRTTTGGPAFDLRGAIRLAFTRAGVTPEAVEVLDLCTFESPDHYSYRREGRTGRHGVLVARS